MGMFKLMGLFALIPTALLLTVSFFVLFALRKVETQALKAFGYVIAVLLWVGALLVFSAGLYTMSTGRCPMMSMMSKMSYYKTPGMTGYQSSGMMGAQMQSMKEGCKEKTMHGAMSGTMQESKANMMPGAQSK